MTTSWGEFMGLRFKFNIAIALAIVLGFSLASWMTERILLANAREEVLQKANVMMQAALSIRAYTVEELRPLLNAGAHDEFLPQTVPAYAATSNFNRLRKRLLLLISTFSVLKRSMTLWIRYRVS